MEYLLPAGLIAPWLTVLVLMGWPRRLDRFSASIGILGAVAGAVLLTAALAGQPPTGRVAVLALPVGSWMLDGLSAMLLLLTSWIHVLVAVFTWRYLPHAQHDAGSSRRDASLYALLNAFTGAMLGMVTSASLIQLYLFWELTGIVSFLLIGYWHHRREAREGALSSLVMTTAGALAMLVAFLALQALAGTGELPELLEGRASWQAHPLLPWITAGVVLGALAKSAQVPFSGWLPGAMAAPTPVSAFLHSSALVASGVYLVARFFPMLHAMPTWKGLLVPLGVAGGLLAGIMALRQTEVKALLAYSTISQYAFIFLAFGLGSVVGAQAGLYAFFVHAFIKAGLFLVSGAVTTLTDEKRFIGLGGLYRTHRPLALLAIALALSLGGVPIFGGFYYKEELLHAAYDQEAWLLLGALLVGGLLTFLYMLRFLTEIVSGEPCKPVERELPVSMQLSVASLAAVAMATGLFPNWMNRAVLNPAIASVIQAPADFAVDLEPGGVFIMSLGVLAVGGALWAIGSRGRIPRHWLSRLPTGFNLGGAMGLRLYEAIGDRLLALHGGNLRKYLRLELLAGLALIAVCWWDARWGGGRAVPFDFALTLMLGISLLAAMATLWLRYHVLAVIALTISGYSLAAIFALMEAPEVALAQVLVETLATFSIVMALRQSRQIRPQETRILTAGRTDWGRWAIALGLGGAIGWLTYEIGGSFPADSAGGHFAAHGTALNGMADLVTAILADFRALDTAIEILVFACAAFAVMGLFPRRGHE